MYSLVSFTVDSLRSDFPTFVTEEEFFSPLRISFAFALVFSIGPLSPLCFFRASTTFCFWTLVIVNCMLVSEGKGECEDSVTELGVGKDLFAAIRFFFHF